MADRPAGVERADPVHDPHRPPRALAPPVPGSARPRCPEPGPPGRGPVLRGPVSPRVDEAAVRLLGHRRGIDEKGGELDGVPGPLVVVGRAPVIGPDLHAPAREAHHPAEGGRAARGLPGIGVRAAARRTVGIAALELEGLEDRFVVLVLVLQDHAEDVAVTDQGGVASRVQRADERDDPLPDPGDVSPALRAAGKGELCPRAPRVQRGIEHPVKGPVRLAPRAEVAEQPDLLEVADVAEIPDQGAHQRIVLHEEFLVRHGCQERQRPVAGPRRASR